MKLDVHKGYPGRIRLIIHGLLILFMVVGSEVPPVSGQATQPSFFKRRSPQTPNIIFILADDLGYGDLGCYGQKKIKTPHLDRLAAEGIRFSQGYAGSAEGVASRAAILTGLHTGHGRIRGRGTASLTSADLTVMEFLKKAGYQTGVIGQWGLGGENTSGSPDRKGVDEWLGILHEKQAHDHYPTYVWRSSLVNQRTNHVLPLEQNFDGQKGLYAHNLFSLAATNFIRISKYEPFFLFLPLSLARANPELTEKTGNGMQVPSDAPYSNEDWPQPEKNKASMITRLDQTVGGIMAQLDSLKLASNTVIFFSSDNGPHREGGNDPSFFASGGPFQGEAGDLREGGIRVPFLVRWPGRIQPGQNHDLPVAHWDFLPTALEIAQTPSPDHVDGISILPTLLGQDQTNRHEFLYWELHGESTQQAVRLREWKGLRTSPDQPVQLFNLTSDPGETKDRSKEHPDIVREIESILISARTNSGLWKLKSKPVVSRRNGPQLPGGN